MQVYNTSLYLTYLSFQCLDDLELSAHCPAQLKSHFCSMYLLQITVLLLVMHYQQTQWVSFAEHVSIPYRIQLLFCFRGH